MEHRYAVYLLASRRNGTLYTGVTGRLFSRVTEHREGLIEGFTKTYGVKHLVWFREFDRVESAIHFEKQLKRWRRAWKIALIEAQNPLWLDLYDKWLTDPLIPPEFHHSSGETFPVTAAESLTSLSSRPERSVEPGPRSRRTDR